MQRQSMPRTDRHHIGLTPNEKRVMGDLLGSLPTDDTDPDDILPDAMDAEHLREHMKGDEAFVEELQEKLRPLCV